VSTGSVPMKDAGSEAKVKPVDMKFEIVVLPVSDVDRAKDFRVIQFTSPGSGCSVIFGKNVTAAAPGSAQGLYLIVSGVEAARRGLLDLGIGVSEVFHNDGVYAGTDEPYLFGRVRRNGPDAEHRSYRSFASFKDPDGNGWLLEELTTRLPGRIDSAATRFASVNDLAGAMRRAAKVRGEQEARSGGQRDENWPDWYASCRTVRRAFARVRILPQ